VLYLAQIVQYDEHLKIQISPIAAPIRSFEY
jgi:hypothetical protein